MLPYLSFARGPLDSRDGIVCSSFLRACVSLGNHYDQYHSGSLFLPSWKSSPSDYLVVFASDFVEVEKKCYPCLTWRGRERKNVILKAIPIHIKNCSPYATE